MARIKGAMMTRKRRKKILGLAKGYWGSKSKHFKMANQAVMKSLTYAYIGRKNKKRDFRKLWITRIHNFWELKKHVCIEKLDRAISWHVADLAGLNLVHG